MQVSRPMAAFMVALLFSGCVSWKPIKPQELAKLSEMPSPSAVGQQGNVTVVAVPTAQVEAPDGRLLEIRAPFNARITAQGQTLVFNHPVRAIPDELGVQVTAGNRAATDFRYAEIEGVEVSQHDFGKTILLTTGIGIAISAITLGVMLSILSSSSGDL